jgi:hypothetical protein
MVSEGPAGTPRVGQGWFRMVPEDSVRCCLSFRRVNLFLSESRSKGVFSGPVFAARCWFLPQGLQSESVDTYVYY